MKKPSLIIFLICSFLAVSCQAKDTTVTLETNFGDIVIELFPDEAPVTVENFLGYVDSGFYDGLIFHRIVMQNIFIIQGGGFDPNMNPQDPCDPIINESYNGLSNLRGTIAMARTSEPHSATSQFYINQQDNTQLDRENYGDGYGYCIFGQVISDMNVIDEIAQIETDGNDLPIGPNSPVIIYTATSSYCTADIFGDIDADCRVDFNDLAIIAADWVQGQAGQESHRGVTTAINENHDISGNIFVWQDNRGSDDDIYGYNLADGNEIAICIQSGDQQEPAISGDIVVWRDDRSGNDDIYGYNLSTETEFVIIAESLPEREPAVSGNIVVWRDYRNYHTQIDGVKLKTDIYGADISDPNNPNVFEICKAIEGQSSPAVDGNIVVWDDSRNGEHDIYGADISDINDPNVFAICTASGTQSNPVIDGNIVIWQDRRFGDMAIYGYDLSTQTEFPIAFGELAGADISGNIVVWQGQRFGGWDIYAADISDHNEPNEFLISIADGNQLEPVISGSTVAWRDYSDVNVPNDLYWRQLCDQNLAGDINGDCKVDFRDFAIMALRWLECNLFPPEDCWD